MRLTVVGSGASGVHFALTALQRGWAVRMLDVGESGSPPPVPAADFPGLKETLDDPVSYFLGRDFGTVTMPEERHKLYGFPPSRDHVFRRPARSRVSARGFEPLSSFARGGLAEAWTAGVYPFDDRDLAEFPFSHSDLAPHYDEVARRIGICGEADDLARFMPLHEGLSPPPELDGHSEHLMDRYRRARRRMNGRDGVFFGRSRLAVLTADREEEDRRACDYLGRCLWGCPRRSIYTPSLSLEACRAYPAFEYVPGVWVDRFRYGEGGRVTSVVHRPAAGGEEVEEDVERLVLAAGTLSSTRIFMESHRRVTGTAPFHEGLMDNRQLLIPFVTLRRVGRAHDSRSYQFHQLGLGFRDPEEGHYVHGQVTTLGAALVHPILQRMPLDAPSARLALRGLRGALGVVNLNFHDSRRSENGVGLRREEGADRCVLEIRYEPSADEGERVRRGLTRVRRALRRLGCLVPPGAAQLRPMGSSVHYAGTIPFSRRAGRRRATPEGRSHKHPNLWFVDGTNFPFLPAKNLTFTLMANAVRVARAM